MRKLKVGFIGLGRRGQVLLMNSITKMDDVEIVALEKDFINHPNSAFDKGMEFRTKRDLKLKLIDVINE